MSREHDPPDHEETPMKSVEQMIEEARREITGHTASEAARRVDDEGALLVDIRDVRELQREGVAVGAHHAPRGMLEFWVDPESPYHKPVFAEDREFIFY
jgi:rhodanese-related sulfurtransferase